MYWSFSVIIRKEKPYIHISFRKRYTPVPACSSSLLQPSFYSFCYHKKIWRQQQTTTKRKFWEKWKKNNRCSTNFCYICIIFQKPTPHKTFQTAGKERNTQHISNNETCQRTYMYNGTKFNTLQGIISNIIFNSFYQMIKRGSQKSCNLCIKE